TVGGRAQFGGLDGEEIAGHAAGCKQSRGDLAGELEGRAKVAGERAAGGRRVVGDRNVAPVAARGDREALRAVLQVAISQRAARADSADAGEPPLLVVAVQDRIAV